ncbi:hypothetical protein [Flagellimonas meishanensis]|uniref:hypothetical protein n=1 Tax=Flagellimonas meishanensis TaxID=2873264 RepID=UPI001CA74133|nr:hypothetical protein [[Muricauda] meishanensis]
MKNWIWPAALLLLGGCSNDENPAPNATNAEAMAFTVIGEDLNRVFQFSYDSETKSEITIDLSQDLGVGPNYLTLRQTDDLLSFYSFSGGRFSISLKEITTGNTRVFDDFYTNTPERSITWGINNANKVFFGYFGPFGNSNLGLQDVELEGPNSSDVVVEFNVGATFDPLLYDNKVYMAFRDNLGNHKLTYYNVETKSMGPSLSFGTTPFGFFITGEGELAIVKNEANPSLERYDALDLSFLESRTLNVALGFSIGAVNDAVLIENQLYFNFIYPQPSRFIKGPAIYDLDTQEITLLDIGGLVNQAEAEVGKAIQIISLIYDPTQSIFLIGYGTLEDEVEGGVLVVSETGDLLKQFSLPFFPTYFVRN